MDEDNGDMSQKQLLMQILSNSQLLDPFANLQVRNQHQHTFLITILPQHIPTEFANVLILPKDEIQVWQY